MDGRFSPAAVSRSVYPSFTPGYGMRPNLAPAGHPVSDSISYGRGSLFNSINQNTQGNGSLNLANNPTKSAELKGSGSRNTGLMRNTYSKVTPGNAVLDFAK
ncbi:hypothetical protein POM88_020108 [Heracleum sosnowskyi]|uniref:Uncharacterized protein n=1 Tax=Heracleum sosnowskyi TaxID=360622 RepID=A0AAD8IBY3_9APIA|nr:hypothetical protein POM88_020108 [Heracleum sosnowskyi]